MGRLPWYAFLYRLFGAQGTFWLWMLSIVALWWTAKPTMHRLANYRETPQSVAQVSNIEPQNLTRWVSVSGVEVRLDRRLLLQRLKSTLPPAPLLLDAADDTARWWVSTRGYAEVMFTGPPLEAPGALGGLSGVMPAHMLRDGRKILEDRFTMLEGGRVPDALPTPERVVLIQEPTTDDVIASSEAPFDPDKPFELELKARLEERAALVLARVRPGRTIEGLLVPTPVTLTERVKSELDTIVAPLLLQEGKEPRDAESWVFLVAALTLVFLAAGFYGATGSSAETTAPVAPAPAPAT